MRKVVSYFLELLLATSLWRTIVKMKPRIFCYPKFPLEEYFTIREIIRKNPQSVYCFVGVDNASLSTKIQRAVFGVYWAHSGFVFLGEDGELYIDHVRWYGILKWNLLKYLRECDEFALLRIPLREGEAEIFHKRLETIKRSQVEYRLRDNIHKEPQYTNPAYLNGQNPIVLYCSEYQYYACLNLTANPIWRTGKERFNPDHVYQGCDVVWEFRV